MAEQENKEVKVRNWNEIIVNEQMPVGLVLNFFNVLNQRLSRIEGLITIKDVNGNERLLKDVIMDELQEEAKKALEEQQQQQKQSNEKKEG